jgi:hypothetical protein
MTRLLLLTLLVAACNASTDSGIQPARFVIYVDGTGTGNPGPYCHVSVNTPAFLTITSHPGVLDSGVAMLNVKAGRYRFSWQVDGYDSGGQLVGTINSKPTDSIDVPGFSYFFC